MAIEFKWYVMETDGNGAVRRANIVTGPYYNETTWFHEEGYDSPEEAKLAVVSYCNEFGNFTQFYIMEGN